MRYEPSQRLFRLARSLAASRTGLTLDEMAAELEVGRRTAERLRDSPASMFPQMECWNDDERVSEGSTALSNPPASSSLLRMAGDLVCG